MDLIIDSVPVARPWEVKENTMSKTDTLAATEEVASQPEGCPKTTYCKSQADHRCFYSESLPAGCPPVAITGMALRLPGGVNSPEEFWKFLIDKKDGLCEVPSTRYNVDSFYHESKPNSVKTKHGYFLQRDLADFDASFFSLGAYEASRMDPQQRQLLEIVWECFESAGETNWRGKDVGCFVGNFGEDWLELASKDHQNADRYHVLGTGDFALANRISYEYDLHGPSMTLRTGCSASLVGLHEACQALYSGECSSAIVAGVNLMFTPAMTTTMSSNLVLSPSGVCRTFDEKADGYGRGEAVNALYIKPLSDALRDNDPIRAVIRSTSTNCDGRTPSITTPGSLSQESLVRKAYAKALIKDLGQTAFFECHGTGTVMGDTAETSVVAKIFWEKGMIIGAVKPNVGHSEGASGITSMIKAVLALEHKTIPPNVFFDTPNSKIPFKEAKLQVPVDAMPWPADRSERISVNCFGIGGSNAHVIVDSHPMEHDRIEAEPIDSESLRLLVVSAKSPDQLKNRIRDITKYANDHPAQLHNLAYTLGTRRQHLEHRAFAVARPNQPLEISNFQSSKVGSSDLIWVFTGQGAQWPAMGRDLINSFQAFKRDIQAMDQDLQELVDAPAWSLEHELSATEESTRVYLAEFAQPLCTALQIGLVNLLKSWGIQPSAVVGHSSGEIAAAYASGAITSRSAITTAYHRGRLAKTQEGKGSMAAIGLSGDAVAKFLDDTISIACENSPRSVTLSGDSDGIDRAIQRIKSDRPNVLCRRLPVNIGYHSKHMHDIGAVYESSISEFIEHNAEMIPLFSSTTSKTITDPQELNAEYWRRNLECPVLFSGSVTQILQASQNRAFLEIGPHSALSGPLRQIFKSMDLKSSPVYIPTLVRNDHDSRSLLLSTVGSIHSQCHEINLLALNGVGTTLTNLPAYPWRHETKYWHESRITRDWRLNSSPHHEILGARVAESSDLEPSWRNLLRLEDVPWIWDHVILDEVLFPAAGFIAMAGETMSQLHPSVEGYSIKNLFLKTPLTLKDGQPTELITTVKPVSLTDLVESDWYSFTISAHDGTTWTKHCHGQVRPKYDSPPQRRDIKHHARPVESEKWYKTMAQHGLSYGEQFQGLTDISVDPIEHIASASIRQRESAPASRYALHPIVIDQCLQLMSVATANGIARRIDRMAIPAAIENLYVGGSASQMDVGVYMSDGGRGNEFGDATLIGDDTVLLSLTKAIFFTLDSANDAAKHSIPLISHMRWEPDIDLMPMSALLQTTPPPFSKEVLTGAPQAGLLYILETADRLCDVTPEVPHVARWKNWIDFEARKMREGKNLEFPESQQWASMDSTSRQNLIKAFTMPYQIRGAPYAIFAECMEAVYGKALEIASGETSPLDILMTDGRLERYYAELQPLNDWSNFMSLLGHSNPRMRILEIGAGTGSATQQILKCLKTPEGARLYSKYTFTDLSPGFLLPAEKNFAVHQSMEYKVLDISKDPKEQGFDLNSFDLVIASNVLHATPRLATTLEHVHKLLAPNGRLLLHELHPGNLVTDYTMGVLPGWWLGEEDGRSMRPYVSPERWDRELRAAGFTGSEAMSYDMDPPHHNNFTMISSAVQPAPPMKEILLLVDSSPCSWANEVADCFEKKGYAVSWGTLNDKPPSDGTCIISLLESSSPFFDQMAEREFGDLQKYITEADRGQIIWVTKSTQMTCPDPRFGFVLGFIRSLRHEMVIDFSTFETETFDDTAARALLGVFEKIQTSRQIPNLEPDYEFVFKDDKVHVSRCHWGNPAAMQDVDLRLNECRKLDLGEYGLVDTLHWTSTKQPELTSGQIEVDMHYVALNFKDIMVVMGVVGDKRTLGIEGSGIIRRIGPDVVNMKPGDRIAVTNSGIYGDRIVTTERGCFKLPTTLSLEGAATMPSAYATAIYSLIHLGCLKAGQTVLIHSACGAVGLAAIRICLLVGAEIFATVGNEEKVQYLMENFGIPRNRIFHSRTAEFLPDIKRETNGRGVDLVLNSLAGKLLHASWECVASFGRMMELGKRDFLTNGVISLARFGQNRTFFGVDVALLNEENPQIFDGLISQFLSWYEEGKIGPITPVKVFDAAEVVNAFRYMQQGVHMGKILLKMPEVQQQLPCSIAAPQISFSPEASFLLVGGLGGIGRAVATWMVEKGARHFVFMSRAAGKSKDDQAFLNELKVQGCHTICVAGTVTSLDDVKRAVSLCKRPLAGVLQMSAVLMDRTFTKMTYEDWSSGIASKVQGTWNLHHAVSKENLEFFVIFGSGSGTCGYTSQTTYAAANTFLDGFNQYRRQLGLPSSVLRPGPVKDAGLVSRDPSLLHLCRSASFRLLEEKDLMEGLQLAITHSSPKSSSGTIIIGLGNTKSSSDPTCRQMWVPEARFSLYQNLETEGDPTLQVQKNKIRDMLKLAEQNPALLDEPEARATICEEIGHLVTQHLVDAEGMDAEKVAKIAIDSLMSIEIRSWMRRNLAIEVSLIDISKGKTVGGLSNVVMDHLKTKFGYQRPGNIGDAETSG